VRISARVAGLRRRRRRIRRRPGEGAVLTDPSPPWRTGKRRNAIGCAEAGWVAARPGHCRRHAV